MREAVMATAGSVAVVAEANRVSREYVRVARQRSRSLAILGAIDEIRREIPRHKGEAGAELRAYLYGLIVEKKELMRRDWRPQGRERPPKGPRRYRGRDIRKRGGH